MVLTKEELIRKIRERVGDSTSDDDIRLLEDVSDTMEDFSERAGDGENWHTKYDALDAEWKEKYDALDQKWRREYIDRFSGDTSADDRILDPEGTDQEEEVELETYEDLFKVVE